jgi:hypothetical protein
MTYAPWLIAAMLGASTIADAQSATALTGNWGGPDISLTLTETGGRIQQGCSVTQIEAPVIPDTRGHFSVVGSRQQWGAGPQRADAPPSAGRPVQISGVVNGSIVNLDVADRHNARETEHHALRAGAHSKLVRCY